MFQSIKNFLAKIAIKFLEWLGFEVIIKPKPKPLPPPEIEEEEIIPEEELEEVEEEEVIPVASRYQWIFYFSYVSKKRPSWNRKLEVIVEFSTQEDPEELWYIAASFAIRCLEEKGFPSDVMDMVKSGVTFIDEETYLSDIEVEINDLERGYSYLCEFPRPVGLR